MTPVYDWLYSHYALAFLRSRDNFETAWVNQMLEKLQLDEEERINFYDEIVLHQDLCARDTFTLGVHFGLQLLSVPEFIDLWELYH